MKHIETGKAVVILVNLPSNIGPDRAEEFILDKRSLMGRMLADTQFVGLEKTLGDKDWAGIVDGNVKDGYKNYTGGEMLLNPKDSAMSLITKAGIKLAFPKGKPPEKCACLRGELVCHIPDCAESKTYAEWYESMQNVYLNLAVLVRPKNTTDVRED